MSRAYTKEEAREMLLDQIRNISEYWSKVDNSSVKDKCDGVAFSILNIFDGCSGGFSCAIDLSLSPHPDDKKFFIGEDENYFESGMIINDDCMLHELYFKEKTRN